MLFPDSPEQPLPKKLVGIARLAAEGELLESKRRVRYYELPTRRLLNRTEPRMPFEWSINPYRGCEFGCRYCYARYTHEFLELNGGADFEEKIFAKEFTAAILRAEIAKIPREHAIAIGTATDPYQPAERRFCLTRRILEVFAGMQGRRLSITTKSDLIARDLDLLSEIARRNYLHVNMTLTTLDPELARLLEPRAPRPDLRLAAMERLSQAGIESGFFPNPVMPWITDSEADLDAVAAAAKRAGASFMGGGVLFLKPAARAVFFAFLEQHFSHLAARYEALFANRAFLCGEYPEILKQRVRAVRQRHGLSDSPVEYTPELWQGDEQGELFPIRGASCQPRSCAVMRDS